MRVAKEGTGVSPEYNLLSVADAQLLINELDHTRHVLERLVQRYVKNASGYSQFIACVTTEKNTLPEWDAALKALGMKVAPTKGKSGPQP